MVRRCVASVWLQVGSYWRISDTTSGRTTRNSALRYERIAYKEAQRSLNGKTILFVGDSNVRNIVFGLVRMLSCNGSTSAIAHGSKARCDNKVNTKPAHWQIAIGSR
jgi:hypothetical protein